MLDIKLDPVTWQPVLVAGDLVIVRGDEELVQHIGIQVRTITREWFLDPTAGLLNLKRMFGKGATENEFRTKLIAKIESNEEIQKGSVVVEFTTTDAPARRRSCKWSARKVNGSPLQGIVPLEVP